ncbi:MAG: hypothetical protein ACRC76_12400, partial [Proteocatella sp.]
MEFKGTKKDWNIVDYNDLYKEIADDNGNTIALVAKYDESEESDSNTILISKAPDLLEMLKKSINEINHLKHTYKDSGHCGRFLRDADLLIKQA